MSVNNISIDTIGLSVRALNALHRIGVHTVGEMRSFDEERLMAVRNLGSKSVREILQKIEEYKALETSAPAPVAAKPRQPEDIAAWMTSQPGREAIVKWMEDNRVGIGALELLSAKAYNILVLAGREQLHQLAFQTKEELMKIRRMDVSCAGEIVTWVEAYIAENARSIYDQTRPAPAHKVLTVEEMRYMPQFRQSILEYVRKNDIPVEKMPLPVRAKNQLTRSGYEKLSDIIFLVEDELKRMPSTGATSVMQIQEMIRDYLHTHEVRILAFCSGDASVLWDETAIRKKILRLFREAPFAGLSLQEMADKIEYPSQLSQDKIKGVIGTLLAEKKLEYVDYRCYRLYEPFAHFLDRCDAVDERGKRILRLRLQGKTLEEIGQEYGVTRENIRQIIKKKMADARGSYAMETGDDWFDEDYYLYFYKHYAFDRREASAWMGIPEAVWKYLDMMDVKQGKKDLEEALDDHENLEIGLRLKVKNYLNRNKIFIDGVWVERKRAELEPIVAAKFCRDECSLSDFARVFNAFLAAEEIPFDEELYYTEAVTRSRKNRLSDARFILWKQNEMLRYYDIDSRDYTELIDTLKLDIYENVEYSTLKFVKEYPELMKKYDIRDHYELHNLLRKTIPEGSFHDFRCGRMPAIVFGTFDRNSAILDILIEMAPVRTVDLCQRISEEYGFDPSAVQWSFLQPFAMYNHDGVYSIDQKVMPADRAEALHRMLPGDFYYMDEVRKIYAGLYPGADMEEINPYNLKAMGFIVLSNYVLQHYPSLEAYCQTLLTTEDIVDLRPLRKRFTYVQMFAQTLMDLKRNLEVIEFEPGQLIHFRRLARAGITKEDIREFCNAVYDFVPDGGYFSAQSLKADGFESELYDLGFSDWFYANLLHFDERFTVMNVFSNIIVCKERREISIQSFLVSRVESHGWIDIFDLMTEVNEHYGCRVSEKSDITYRLRGTKVYHDRILDRLYASAELYYRDLDNTGGF